MTLNIGATVGEIGGCRHRDGQIGQGRADCWHQGGTVVHKFQDGVSFWVVNPYGFAKRILMTHLVGNDSHKPHLISPLKQ